MGIKQDFIEAIRNTPDGIKDFLSVAIPTLQATTCPTDKDSSILTQGVLAHNLNCILLLFVGLTPVEMVLRVGQHSNVIEAILLSCLEYIPESNAEQDLTIEEPIENQAYAPGDIRIIVKAKGKISTMTATTEIPNNESPEGQPELQIIDLTSTDGEIFYGYVRLSSAGDYTTSVSATFDDKDQTIKSASVNYSISEDGDVQADLAEFELAAKAVEDSSNSLMSWVVDTAKGAALEWAVKRLVLVVLAL
jgi:hypothetical protein